MEVITLSELISFPRKNMECKHIKFHGTSNVTDDSSTITKEDKTGVSRERVLNARVIRQTFSLQHLKDNQWRQREVSKHPQDLIHKKKEGEREREKEREGSRREWRCLHNKWYYCGL